MEDFSGFSRSCYFFCYVGFWDGLDGFVKGFIGWNGVKMIILILDIGDEGNYEVGEWWFLLNLRVGEKGSCGLVRDIWLKFCFNDFLSFLVFDFFGMAYRFRIMVEYVCFWISRFII